MSLPDFRAFPTKYGIIMQSTGICFFTRTRAGFLFSKRSRLRYIFQIILGYKILKTERFSGILHDPTDNFLAAYGAEVWDIVVHATVVLRTPYSPAVHETAFIDINEAAVFLVVDQMTPRHLFRLSAERKVCEPAL